MATPMLPDKKLEFGAILGMGGSCFIYYVNADTVHKSYGIWVNGRRQSYYPEKCESELVREAAVYEHLGKHDSIIGYYGLDVIHSDPDVHAPRLELAPLRTVRRLIEQDPDRPLPEPTRMQMCRDAAAAIAHIHSRGVGHSDLSCRNLMVLEGYRLKLCAFGGSMIAEQADSKMFASVVAEEQQYHVPLRDRGYDNVPRIKRELFALGSCMYEISAWKRPFQGLKDHKVRTLYAADNFPSLDGSAIAAIISPCWQEEVQSADDAVTFLDELIKKQGEES